MRRFFSYLILGALSSLPWSAQALWISEHATLTRAVLERFNQCHSNVLPAAIQEILIESNLDEDRNFLRKWLTYSHFFSPHRDLDQRRKTSLDRLIEIESHLTRSNVSSGMEWAALGIAIHHIQDSAVPAHVIPVNHWLADGFEALRVELKSEDIPCADWSTNLSLTEILIWSAEQTLQAASTPPWNRFWIEPNRSGFGSYGKMGNAFGDSKVWSERGYKLFKHAQLKQAAQATQMAIEWFLRLLRIL